MLSHYYDIREETAGVCAWTLLPLNGPTRLEVAEVSRGDEKTVDSGSTEQRRTGAFHPTA